MRIVSLLPSATDIVCLLGLQENLVGRTHECDWSGFAQASPGQAATNTLESVPVVTKEVLGTHAMTSREIHDAIGRAVHSGSSVYHLDTEALEAARPDLILTQELCEVCAVSYKEVTQAARLLEADTQIVSLEPSCIDDILDNILLVGQLTGAEERAAEIVDDVRDRLGKLREATKDVSRPRVVCIEWLDPLMAAGHWVPEQVEIAGGRELVGRPGHHSHVMSWNEVVEAQPEILVLMPCGFSVDQTLNELDALTRRPGWDNLPAVLNDRVYAVDAASYFNRPGPRVVRGAEILFHLLHPRAGNVCEPPNAVEAQAAPRKQSVRGLSNFSTPFTRTPTLRNSLPF